MAGADVVFLKILSLLPVIGVGWLAARRGWLGPEAVRAASRIAVDVALPALTVGQLVRTVTPGALRSQGFVPLAGALLMVLGAGVGAALAPALGERASRRTFVFLVSLANSIYLPLPIASALYGDEGVRAVLLAEVGTRVVLFTLGVAILMGRRPGVDSLRELLLNPGLVATVAGIAAALLFPSLGTLGKPGAPAFAGAGVVTALLQAVELVGSLTIPLALLVTGAKLEESAAGGDDTRRSLAGVVAARLLVMPAVVGGILLALAAAGVSLDEAPRRVVFLVACMPVAVNCGVLTERYGGDSRLAARATLASTVLSVATVPALFLAAVRLGI